MSNNESAEHADLRQRLQGAALKLPVIHHIAVFIELVSRHRFQAHMQHLMNHPRWKKVQRICSNVRITLICGFITILVLRGTMGAGKFGTPEQDVIIKKGKNRGTDSSASDSLVDEQGGLPNVGPEIKDWDRRREQRLLLQPGCNLTSSGRSRLLLVTSSRADSCDHPVGDHLLLKGLKNRMDYARLWEMEVYFGMAELEPRMAGDMWAKLPLLRHLLIRHPDVEWFWWLDADAFITDMKFRLPLERYEAHDLVIGGSKELIFDEKDWGGLSTGSFLIRNSQWSLDLLARWALMGPRGKTRQEAGTILTAQLKGRPAAEADDQSALVWLLNQEKERLGSRVYLESIAFLQAYWSPQHAREEADSTGIEGQSGDSSVERLPQAPTPFVTHFAGCKPCGDFGDFEVEQCINGMNRAFHLADNQILRRYGFTHFSLSSSAVLSLNITTRASLAERKARKRTKAVAEKRAVVTARQ
eukprot:TRINITY_DN33574_c0_g1_i1.p1 TRINITY_DN33574_c0_g1~~TRINITY_DN33574_c0_g1_i1.p1  ORF type:complete len:472 (+),score=68.36 TRINITY_DN33574_c0_g1_i1:123-1538(+)